MSKSGDLHGTTIVAGKIVKDRKHITISVKDPSQVVNYTHRSVHGYTESLNAPSEIESIAKETKRDDTKDHRGKEVWPRDLEGFFVIYVDPEDLELSDQKDLPEKYAKDVTD